jgi:multiple sugar transport system permease protein
VSGPDITAPAPAARPARAWGRRRGRLGDGAWGYVFSLPGVALLLAFLVVPFGLAIYLSLTSQRLASPLPVEFVGLRNYGRVLGDSDFWHAFRNNLVFAAVVVPVQTALALWMAILVNRRIRAVKVFRAILFLPVVTVLAVAATIWLLLYDPSSGLANGFLRLVTFGAVESDWLQSTAMALPAIMIMSIWQGAGFQMVILLAGLQDIPGELYEAASIDGASRRKQFLYITLPQLRNTLIFVVTVTTILAFRLFDQVYVMTRGGPLGSTNTMMLELVNVGYERKQIARASAIAVIFFVVVLGLTLVQRRLIKEDRDL